MKLTEREIHLVAALLGFTNMGLETEDYQFEEMVASYREGCKADELVLVMASPYIESDEIETAFAEEAGSWVPIVSKYNWDQLFKTYRHHEQFRFIRNTDPSRQDSGELHTCDD